MFRDGTTVIEDNILWMQFLATESVYSSCVLQWRGKARTTSSSNIYDKKARGKVSYESLFVRSSVCVFRLMTKSSLVGESVMRWTMVDG